MIFKHELKRYLKTFLVWLFSIAALILVCMLLYPEMKGSIENVNDMFSDMGSFTEAFGMNRLNFGTPMGFYGIEVGSILSIGAPLFAAQIGISLLAKEEGQHTAEFLFSHPISRTSVYFQKYAAMLFYILLFNILCIAVAIGSFIYIGEEILWKEFFLYHLAIFVLQIEIGTICFGISAFLRKNALGLGFGLALILYFMNIVANISKNENLKYTTPYQYADPSTIIPEAALEWELIGIGLAVTLFFILVGYIRFVKKDLSI